MVDSKMSGLGPIVIAFVAIIIGLSLLGSTMDTIGTVTGTFSQVDSSTALINGTPVNFLGAGFNATVITSVVIGPVTCNETTDWVGDLSANTINLTGAEGACDTGTYNVSYSYQTNDYIEDGATRSITNLIIIFFALAIMSAGFIAVGGFDMFKGFGNK